jgi:hypothetical protein
MCSIPTSCISSTPLAAGGLIGSRAHVWSEDGRLVATGISQLFCRPNPLYPR